MNLSVLSTYFYLAKVRGFLPAVLIYALNSESFVMSAWLILVFSSLTFWYLSLDLWSFKDIKEDMYTFLLLCCLLSHCHFWLKIFQINCKLLRKQSCCLKKWVVREKDETWFWRRSFKTGTHLGVNEVHKSLLSFM